MCQIYGKVGKDGWLFAYIRRKGKVIFTYMIMCGRGRAGFIW